VTENQKMKMDTMVHTQFSYTVAHTVLISVNQNGTKAHTLKNKQLSIAQGARAGNGSGKVSKNMYTTSIPIAVSSVGFVS
jgi:hypothetical protein